MEEKDVDIKARFRKWMSKTKKEDGEPYSENTINAYCNAMSNAPEKLEIDHQYQKPIFAYTDIHEYNKVKEIIFTAPNFDAVNKEAGNQALKYGMILYNQFLNEVFNNKNILAHNETLQTNNLKSKLADLLEHTHNLILHGAPGTGKTYLAKEIAKAMNAKTAFVQFHPSYDYTDFVEGLRPVPQDDAGQISFELRDGIFKSFCEKALENLTDFEESNSNNNFDKAWDKLLEIVRENIAKGKLTKIGIWEYSLSSTNSLKYQSEDSPSKYSFTITKKNVFDAYRNIQARPSGYFQKYMKEVADYMKEHCGLIEYKKQEQQKNTNILSLSLMK